MAFEEKAAGGKDGRKTAGPTARHADLKQLEHAPATRQEQKGPERTEPPSLPAKSPASSSDNEVSIPERADVVITGTHVIWAGQPVYAGGATLSMEPDGNFVIRDSTGVVRWTAKTATMGDRAVFQDDGNLVVVAADGRAVWSSGTAGNPGALLLVQETGRVLIRSAGGAALWSAGAFG
ncbi:hypothetical protein ACIBBE_49065 [Streptomyces sp. NPDC051644]|uniref:hypothetical protein n=1 Tax=Streptomyces sp. NPDC051644 TaxID=3365666 RepID=UPI0037B430E0